MKNSPRKDHLPEKMPTTWNHALPNTMNSEKTGTVTNTVPPPNSTTSWWWWWVAGAIFIIFLLIIIALIVYWNRKPAPVIYTDECGNIIGTKSMKDPGLVCQPKCPQPVPVPCNPCAPAMVQAPIPTAPVQTMQYPVQYPTQYPAGYSVQYPGAIQYGPARY